MHLALVSRAQRSTKDGVGRVRSLSRHALVGPVPVFSCVFSDSECSIPGLTISSTHTSSFPRRMSAPGFCNFASLTPKRGVGGAPRNVRVRPKHPLGVPSCVKDARERAYDAGRSPLGAPPWR